MRVVQFVLNPLASAEVVLTESERNMGAVVCDIGGGTTDMAIYVNGDVWHTMVLAVGGNHITQDIAHGLRLPLPQAEEVKKAHGYAVQSEIGLEETFTIQPFGELQPVKMSRRDLAHIIEARVAEMFELMLQEIKRSGYDNLLPAGMVLTGGTSLLPGIRQLAIKVLGMPVRTAQPEKLLGLADKLNSPAIPPVLACSPGQPRYSPCLYPTTHEGTRGAERKSKLEYLSQPAQAPASVTSKLNLIYAPEILYWSQFIHRYHFQEEL